LSFSAIQAKAANINYRNPKGLSFDAKDGAEVEHIKKNNIKILEIHFNNSKFYQPHSSHFVNP